MPDRTAQVAPIARRSYSCGQPRSNMSAAPTRSVTTWTSIPLGKSFVSARVRAENIINELSSRAEYIRLNEPFERSPRRTCRAMRARRENTPLHGGCECASMTGDARRALRHVEVIHE